MTYLLVFIIIIFSSGASVFWKKMVDSIGGLSITGANFGQHLPKAIGSQFTWYALTCSVLALVFLLDLFSREDISYAIPLISFSYILILLFAKFFLHEDISLFRWVGVGLIIIGILLITKMK